MAEREKPRPQDIYRHFKNKDMIYQIITLALNTETEEEMVVYQALYGDFKIYVRPLSMFLSQVEKDKYPDANSEYRFEKVLVNEEETYQENCQETASYGLLEFLDADTYEKKRNILIHMRHSLTDRLIDDIAASMDVTVESGNIDERYASLLKCVDTLSKYEVNR